MEENPKKDIFDRLMSLPLLRFFEPFYRRHKSVLLYLFFGGATTGVNWLFFWLFYGPCGMHELVANLLAWVLAVLFAFFTNRIWVFAAPTSGALAFLRQLFLFTLSRVTTFLLEEGAVWLFITTLRFPAMPVKILAAIAVVILNYVFSRIVGFRRKQ